MNILSFILHIDSYHAVIAVNSFGMAIAFAVLLWCSFYPGAVLPRPVKIKNDTRNNS